MPAKSGSQRRAAGSALGAKRGPGCETLPKGSASRQMCEGMSARQLRDFARGKAKK